MLAISFIDWCVIGFYLFGLVIFAAWLSRKQFNREDYYVGGRHIGPWPIAISIMATQCSTNSILGAPAFVAFAAGGGLVWLQYELAVPLAMVVLIIFFMPLFRSLSLVTVYGYIERRFDRRTRWVLSGLFMFVRAFATAVTVYSIAIVINLITGLGFFMSVLLLGIFTVVYDVLGGIKGVIYSDVLQLIILVVVLCIVAGFLVHHLGGVNTIFDSVDESRLQAIKFSAHGLGDGETFAFWPMFFGGLFLYVSYYGCDQSQAQRELSARTLDDSNRALLYNGLLRFPLVALYCFVGLGIAAYAQLDTQFLAQLPKENGSVNVNLAVPAYMIQHLPVGLVGLGLVALFAAAMSSLDCVLNSLSASSMEDVIRPLLTRPLSDKQELNLSRLLTIFWGATTLIMAFFVGDIAPTVLEAINKIGSLINGPILGVFVLGIATRTCNARGALAGLLAGFVLDGILWLGFPEISWLWWNVFGFLATLSVGLLASAMFPTSQPEMDALIWRPTLWRHFTFSVNWLRASVYLFVFCLTILALLVTLPLLVRAS